MKNFFMKIGNTLHGWPTLILSFLGYLMIFLVIRKFPTIVIGFFAFILLFIFFGILLVTFNSISGYIGDNRFKNIILYIGAFIFTILTFLFWYLNASYNTHLLP